MRFAIELRNVGDTRSFCWLIYVTVHVVFGWTFFLCDQILQSTSYSLQGPICIGLSICIQKWRCQISWLSKCQSVACQSKYSYLNSDLLFLFCFSGNRTYVCWCHDKSKWLSSDCIVHWWSCSVLEGHLSCSILALTLDCGGLCSKFEASCSDHWIAVRWHNTENHWNFFPPRIEGIQGFDPSRQEKGSLSGINVWSM